MISLLLATMGPRHRSLPPVGRLAGTSLSAESHSIGYEPCGFVGHNHDLVWVASDVLGDRVVDESVQGRPPGSEQYGIRCSLLRASVRLIC